MGRYKEPMLSTMNVSGKRIGFCPDLYILDERPEQQRRYQLQLYRSIRDANSHKFTLFNIENLAKRLELENLNAEILAMHALIIPYGPSDNFEAALDLAHSCHDKGYKGAVFLDGTIIEGNRRENEVTLEGLVRRMSQCKEDMEMYLSPLSRYLKQLRKEGKI
jgi:hypothetical protein